MKEINVKLKFFIVILFVLCNTGIISGPLEDGQSKSTKLNDLLNYCENNDLFSGAVLITEKGLPIFKKAYGFANREWNIKNTVDTKFRIGSLTKSFTSMLIMQLVHERKLKLDDKISVHLDYYRTDTGDKVSVMNLLTHTSGISNFKGIKNPELYSDKLEYKLSDYISRFCMGDLESEPGTAFVYSNKGYIILGAIIESITKKSFSEVLIEKILVPLEMTNTGVDSYKKILKKRASGYIRLFDGYKNASYIDTSSVLAAGAIFSTVEDLSNWDHAFNTNKLVPHEAIKKMFTPYMNKYGLGWWIMDDYVGHSGEISGFQSRIQRFTRNGNSIILLSNSQLSKLKEIASAIELILENKKWDYPKVSFSHKVISILENSELNGAVDKLYSIAEKNSSKFLIDSMEFYELAEYFMNKGEIKKSKIINEFNNKINPDKWFVFYQSGILSKIQNKKAEALDSFKKALSLYPRKGSNWYKKISSEIKNLEI